MVRFSGATLKEKWLVKRVEKAVFAHLGQSNFFQTDLTIVDEDTIRALNVSTRNIDSVTDVLSFPQFEPLELPVSSDKFGESDYDEKGVLLGNVMICRQRAIEQAKEYGHSYERELGFLACHGFLHILGFDHVETDDEKIMLAHQKAIMQMVGLRRN